MWQNAIYLLIVVLIGFSCQPTTIDAPLSYPATVKDSLAVDTIHGRPVAVPFDTLYRWDSNQQDQWLEEQLAFTLRHLGDGSAFRQNWLPDRLEGFPQQVGDQFYCLGYRDGQLGLLKGSDLTTIRAYDFWMNPERIPTPYYIADFQIIRQATAALLLLKDPQRDGFYPALWQAESDTLHIWSTTSVEKAWTYDAGREQLLLLAADRSGFYQLDLASDYSSWIDSPFPPEVKLSIAGLLPKGGYLIQKEQRSHPVQFWSLQDGTWTQQFELDPGAYSWLGQRDSLHYLRSNLNENMGQVFDFQQHSVGSTTRNVYAAHRAPMIAALLAHNRGFSLHEGQGAGFVREWRLDGTLERTYHLPPALTHLDLQYYDSSGTLLVRQLSPEMGIRYIAINQSYQQVVEPVSRSLSTDLDGQLAMQWISFTSYDGTAVSAMLVRKKTLQKIHLAPTLFVPMPADPVKLLASQPDLALSHRFLQQNGLLVFVFPRGNKRLGQQWYEQGSGPRLQLAFDDLQACLAYTNTQRLGHPAKRAVWGTAEQGLTAAALLVQRPELAQTIFLAESGYDWRADFCRKAENYNTDWWLFQDTIPNRLLQQYSPYLHPLNSDNSPKTMVQSGNPYIFGPSAVFLAKLQQSSPRSVKLWAPLTEAQVKGADNKRIIREQLLDQFIY